MARKLKIAVLDLETDPFLHGRVPQPFAAGFLTDEDYTETWGPNCVQEIMEDILARKQRYVIYAHNGGRFDFHYLFPWLQNPISIINARIVKAKCGDHWLQDSFAVLPVPLHLAGGKIDIDYSKFEKNKREKFRPEISKYLEADCVALYEFISRFESDFGRQITVGSTAIKQLAKTIELQKLPYSLDAIFRPYYYGGRVECFKHGDIKGNFVALDRNSMYPTVMKEIRHPFGGEFDESDQLPEDPEKVYFAEIDATSRGALPVRTKTGIDFPNGRGTFLACSHEINAARELGLIEIHSVNSVRVAQQTISFPQFVDHFWDLRKVYKEAGDIHGDWFCKFMLNSCYGKFGTNIENFKDWLIVREGEGISDADLREDNWGIDAETGDGPFPHSTCPEFQLYCRPAADAEGRHFDVSIAASITSAARANLLAGIHKADNPIYCDTDSIICRSADLPLGKNLGDWKVENHADRVCIAGKKLYALALDGKWTKVRSKGGTLSGDEIARIARGEKINYQNQAPTFSLGLVPKFVKRQFEMTAGRDI